MKSFPLLLALLSPIALAQVLDPPKIIREQSGNITNFRAEGSLAATQVVGCIPLSQVKNTYTPADLYKGVADCIVQEQYDLAVELFMIAGVYSKFDAERITDKTAGQAGPALVMNTLSTLPQDKRTRFAEAVSQISGNPDLLKMKCDEVQKIGAPNYYPSYMILSGLRAFTGNPHEGALVKDFDASSTWKNVQISYLHCASSGESGNERSFPRTTILEKGVPAKPAVSAGKAPTYKVGMPFVLRVHNYLPHVFPVAIQICASADKSIFNQLKAGVSTAQVPCYAPGTGLASSNRGDDPRRMSLFLSAGDGHNYYNDARRIDGPGYTDIFVAGIRGISGERISSGIVYAIVFVDDNQNRLIEDREYELLELEVLP